MAVTAEAIKKLAVDVMKAKFGKDLGGAYEFLMFGGFGVPGLVDGATLAAKGNEEAGVDFTEDMAVSLVASLAKAGIKTFVEHCAAGAVQVGETTAEAVASMSVLVLIGLFDSTPVGPEPLPPVIVIGNEPEGSLPGPPAGAAAQGQAAADQAAVQAAVQAAAQAAAANAPPPEVPPPPPEVPPPPPEVPPPPPEVPPPPPEVPPPPPVQTPEAPPEGPPPILGGGETGSGGAGGTGSGGSGIGGGGGGGGTAYAGPDNPGTGGGGSGNIHMIGDGPVEYYPAFRANPIKQARGLAAWFRSAFERLLLRLGIH